MSFVHSGVLTLFLGAATLGSAAAQTSAPAAPPAVTAPAPPVAVNPSPGPTDQQIADEVNARIALLKANLRLSDAQAAQWPVLEAVLRDATMRRAKERLSRRAAEMSEREAFRSKMKQWREERGRFDNAQRPEFMRGPRGSELDQMREQADAMAARAAEMRSIADAAGPLFGTLDDRQRDRFFQGLRQIGETGTEGGRRGRGWDN